MGLQQGTTTQRGYGRAHQKLQAQAIAAWQPGDPCTRCGRPMWQRWTVSRTGKRISAIHLGHDDNDRTRYRGLEHASCNEAAAARKRNRMYGKRRAAAGRTVTAPAALRTSRQW
jgi:hypothetical protein